MKAIRLGLRRGAHLAIGLMSGTSHDGVSAALVRLDRRANPRAQVIAFATTPYRGDFRARLLVASSAQRVGVAAISALNFEVGRAFGRAAIKAADAGKVSLEEVSFIGSHGHTVFHLPPRRARRGETASTMQIGESAVIAAMTGVPVVADFRPMDVALGGEGAPLAPLAHLWLFGDRRVGRVVQNIGGIGNATFLRAGATLGDPSLIAFDTGPGGMLIDALAAKVSDGRMKMDREGRMAARGNVSEALLSHLMRNPYFRRRPPKSTGREEFGVQYLEQIEERARALSVGGDDLIATVTALTARSIAEAVRHFIMPLGKVEQLIATGGGARNPVLLRMIAAGMPGVSVLTAEQAGVNAEALECVAFAILAYQMLRGEQGNVPTVTGARSPAMLGKLTLPPNPE